MTRRPPALATTLLMWLPSTPARESLLGDLEEQYQAGRSTTWYWRQAIGALCQEVWDNRWLILLLVVMGLYLPEMYSRILPPRVQARLDALWYRQLLDSRWSWLVLSPWSYVLEIRGWQTWIAFCGLLMSAAWLASRVCTHQHRLIVTVLTATQVGRCLPNLRFRLLAWLHDPTNPMWFFTLVWFTLFALVAAPLSIWIGAAAACRQERTGKSVSASSGDLA